MSKNLNICAILGITAAGLVIANCQVAEKTKTKDSDDLYPAGSEESVVAKLIAAELEEAQAHHRLPPVVFIEMGDVQDLNAEELRSSLSRRLTSQALSLSTSRPADTDPTTIVSLEKMTIGDQGPSVVIRIKWGVRLGYGVHLWQDGADVKREVMYRL